jgi:hypothetical protein
MAVLLHGSDFRIKEVVEQLNPVILRERSDRRISEILLRPLLADLSE